MTREFFFFFFPNPLGIRNEFITICIWLMTQKGRITLLRLGAVRLEFGFTYYFEFHGISLSSMVIILCTLS